MNANRKREDIRRPSKGQVQPASEPAQRAVGVIVGVLALAVFMSSLDLFIVNLAFPYIGKEYPGTTLKTCP